MLITDVFAAIDSFFETVDRNIVLLLIHRGHFCNTSPVLWVYLVDFLAHFLHRVNASCSGLSEQIIEKFRRGVNARDQQIIPGSRASDVQQMTLGVVGIFEIRLI